MSKIIERERKKIDYFTDDELLNVPVGDAFVFDIESFSNYFLIAFKHVLTHKVVTFEDSEHKDINHDKLEWFIFRFLIIGFNSNSYDMPMMCKALQGLSCNELKNVSDKIINENVKVWNQESVLGFTRPTLNHIDLIEVCPLEGSLKAYGARLHTERLQDLPYEPDRILTREEQLNVEDYCVNADLETTILILENLKEQLDLRIEMSQKYNVDLRSKSDAQIAETLICKEIAKIKGWYPKKPVIAAGTSYKYNPPSYLQFQTKQFIDMFEIVKNAVFTLDERGSSQLPDGLNGLIISCGISQYKLGIGGLHSMESTIAHIANDDEILQDNDVESYYPRIILNNGYAPSHIGNAFLNIFDDFVETRLTAKHNKDKSTANSLKIVINGTFGKLGSKYSALYAPDLMLQVTLTGQLSLLMLIEMLELNGIPVINGNTDGIVIKVKKSLLPLSEQIVKQWEKICNFKTEQTNYLGYYSRDVNNYMAVKEDKKCKTKGAFNNPWNAEKLDIFRFHKNPVMTITIEAVEKLITENIPIEQTIKNCNDIRKFIIVRNVKGGAEKDGVYLGKVVRWYYAKGEGGELKYCLSGNKVPVSDGGKPLMDLPESFPNDIDYERYCNEANEMLYSIGYLVKPITGLLF